MVRLGFTVLKIGTITVGPVTTINAPKRIERSQEKPIIKCVPTEIAAQVIRTPIVNIFLTTLCKSRISSNFKVKLPSKRMIATASDTIGNNKSPKRASGFSVPVRGPKIIPAKSRKTIAGNLTHQANHWQRMATTPMVDSAIIACSCIKLFPYVFVEQLLILPD